MSVTHAYVEGTRTAQTEQIHVHLCKCPGIRLDGIASPTIKPQQLKHLKAELFIHVDKSQLSSTKRKLTSAGDARVSSREIRGIGVIILMVVGTVIVLADLIRSANQFFWIWYVRVIHYFMLRFMPLSWETMIVLQMWSLIKSYIMFVRFQYLLPSGAAQ